MTKSIAGYTLLVLVSIAAALLLLEAGVSHNGRGAQRKGYDSLGDLDRLTANRPIRATGSNPADGGKVVGESNVADGERPAPILSNSDAGGGSSDDAAVRSGAITEVGSRSRAGSPSRPFSYEPTPLGRLLMQIVLIIVAARLAGALFARLGQPSVVGEMAAGLALGPSVLGALLPRVAGLVFPPGETAMGSLNLLSQIGIVLFMFVVGMDLDTGHLRQRAHSAVLISHTSIILPFLLGLAAARWLYGEYAGERASYPAFALFLGISMSITAFPVLARIIQERNLTGTALGSTAVTCAAVDDITAWTALAFIVALSKAQSLAAAGGTALLSGLFVALMLVLVRPALRWMTARLPDAGNPGASATAAALVTVFLGSLYTETIGIHALFGAFFAGIVMPQDASFRRFLGDRLGSFSTLFLMPVFFAFTGLRTHVGLLHGSTDWIVCALLLVIAVAGKFGGSAAAARITGMSWRDAAAVGALMNTRGLMELIALNVGLDLGVLSPKVFTMLVLMAILTTFSAGPVLQMLGVGRIPGRRHTDEAWGTTRG